MRFASRAHGDCERRLQDSGVAMRTTHQANRFSIFTGSSRTRTPVAWCTADVTAAAKPAKPISPMPRAPSSLISLSG